MDLSITIFIFYCVCGYSTAAEIVHYLNRYAVKVADEDIGSVRDDLDKLGLLHIHKIVPNVYEFRRVSQYEIADSPDNEFLEQLKACCNGKVLDAEHAKKHTIALSTTSTPRIHEGNGDDKKELPIMTYDDIGILKAWARGYSGNDVTIAVTGVGINTDLEDLKPNVDKELCFNAIEGTDGDVRPKTYPNYPHESQVYTNHENMCAGLIGAAKNGNCGDGVAHSSKLVGVKLFNVKKFKWDQVDVINTDIARGLGYAHKVIAVYSNSWSSSVHFATHIGMASMEALKIGTAEGRGGKGSVYVFPVGAINDGYANSVYTITVNGVGIHGTIQPYTGRGACVLTTTFGEASQSNSELLTTCTSTPSQCINDFRGTSAATAMVAGIVALAIEANPSLTWRDIQHMLVKASETDHHEERNRFFINGAGHFFHPQFGFGMVNASKVVELAEKWPLVPIQKCVNVAITKRGCHQNQHQWMCDADMEMTNIGQVEHVTVMVSYRTPNEHNTKIVVISPSNTTSVLMDYGQSKNTRTYRQDVTFLSVNFWGELVAGTWTVTITNRQTDGFGPPPSMLSVSITICGTGNFKQTVYSTSTVENDSMCEKCRKWNGSKIGAAIAVLYPIVIFIFTWIILKILARYFP